MARRKMGGKVVTTRLPPYVKLILLHLAKRLEARRTIHCLRGRPWRGGQVERFRTDAKAEGDVVTIGGYQSYNDVGLAIPHQEAK